MITQIGTMMTLCADPETIPSPEALAEAIHPEHRWLHLKSSVREVSGSYGFRR